MAKINNGFFKWVFGILLAVLFVIALLFAGLQTDYVKEQLAHRVVDYVTNRTGYSISLEQVEVRWFDRVSVKNARVLDSQDSIMYEAERSTLNYSLTSLIGSSRLAVEAVSIKNGSLNLYRHNDSSGINLLDFISRLGSGASKKQSTAFGVGEIACSNLRVGYRDLLTDPPTNGIFKPSYFDFEIPLLHAENLSLVNDSLKVSIRQFQAKERYSGLPIQRFSAEFYLLPTAIILDDLYMATEKSLFADSIALSFSKPGNLSYFTDSVNMHLELSNSSLDFRDLRYFSEIPEIPKQLIIDGTLQGSLSSLDVKDCLIRLDTGGSIHFDAIFRGLPRLNETFVELDIKDATIDKQLLSELSGGQIALIEKLTFQGALLGFLTDFVVFGRLGTGYGKIDTDINLKLSERILDSRYSGNFSFTRLRAGALLGIKELKTMDFRGNIKGAGFDVSNADFVMNATAQNVVFQGHSYDSLGLNGRFRSRFFDGFLGVKDERGMIDGKATIDFSVPKEVISVDLSIDSIDLRGFSLTEKNAWFSSKVKATLSDTDINNMQGEIALNHFRISSDASTLSLDTVKISGFGETEKTYRFQSDILDAGVSGDFQITELIQDLPTIVKSFTSEFILDDAEQTPEFLAVDYRSSFDFDVKSLNPLFRLLDIPFAISDGAQIEVEFKHLSDVSFNLFASIDTVKYQDRFFYGNELLVDASKSLSSEEVLALVQFSSLRQAWNDEITTQDFSLEAIWDQNVIRSSVKIAQPENKNRADLRSITTLKRDTIEFKVLPSDVIVFNTGWTVNSKNQILATRDRLVIDDLELLKGSQLVSLNGVLSDSSYTELNFDFQQFDLLNLSTISPRAFGGVVDASGSLTRSTGGQPLRIETDIEVEELSFEGVIIGDLVGMSAWDRSKDGLFVDYAITRENVKTIDLSGYLRPFEENQLDVQVSFDEAKLDLLEPLFETLISDLDGTATGELNLSGPLTSPKLRGVSTIKQGVVTIDYLNTSYQFSGVTRFFEEQIAFDNIVVTDRFNHRGALNGAINHKQFKNVALNVSMNFDQLELLNTNRQQNSLYYGNAYATGRLDIKGPVENILIAAEATSTDNTRVYIPLIEESSAQQGAFIKFKQKMDSTTLAEDEIDLSGINIDFDLDITPDAYIELIFNPRTGDIIRGRGNGNLQLTINSSGDFDLFGNYTVTEGAYNFTTVLINKEFQLVPGGVINWFGDPYQGQMDLTATYRQLANIQDWNPNDSTLPKAMVNVNLDMEGPMLAPDINFKLQLDDQNTADPRWNQAIATINSEEEELKRQVFSLLILRKFSQRNEFIVGGQNSITDLTSSVSEFVSNQLSYWFNQFDENLEIDFDINSLSADAFNTFQLRLAYSFLDGRLRVTRGGGVTTIVEEESGTDLQGILGDWSIEYVLTEDGKWRARFFSRNNQYTTAAQQDQETGLSLQYVTSFDEFREIIKSGRKTD